jgi:hypothetical protein
VSDTTAAFRFRKAFFEISRDLFEDDPDYKEVSVFFGYPDTLEPWDVVAVEGISSEQSAANIGPRRAREELLTLTIQISVFRAGGGDQEIVTADRAYDLLGRIERYIRLEDPTVKGTVRQCFLLDHDSDGTTDESTLQNGRVTDITARFAANARIT